MIQNRIEKNYRKLKAWAEKNQIEAYRIYDRDIPEFPYLVDKYKDFILVYDKSQKIDEAKNHLPVLLAALKNIFQISEDQIITKKRQIQKGLEQYQKLNEKNEKIVIKENNVNLYVNLWDYLDTGLFLDHRPIRYQFLKKSKGLKFLNLFCYTASASVMAAIGGATTCSVDMSKTYLDWAKENFTLNNIPLNQHSFIEHDVLQFIADTSAHQDLLANFDCIFLDPPTFSNSKKMKTDFDVDRDQISLIEGVLKFLKPDGILYFSCNKRDFKLSEELQSKYLVKNITKNTIPIDVHDLKIHHCFEIKFKP